MRALVVALLLACSAKEEQPVPGKSRAVFRLDTDFASADAFFDFPYPSDLRLRDGKPIGKSFPNPLNKKLVENLQIAASERRGFPVMPTGYFRFDRELPPRSIDDVVPADPSSPVLLIDVDPGSSERGRLFPVVTSVLPTDDYVPEHVLGVAPRPGFVLHGNRKYAFVVTTVLGVEVSEPIAELQRGGTPAGPRGAEMRALYAPLFETLKQKGIANVAAATVFTTGDVAAEFAAMSDKVLAAHKAKIANLKIDPDDGASHPRYCELRGTLTIPQFQPGKAPYDTGGYFVMEGDLPKKQADETIPITVTIPRGTMPAGGWPLVMYFHGSGGLSTAPVDRGRWRLETDASKCPEGTLGTWEKKTGCNTKGEGPAHVVAAHGFAMAGSAFPVNPERLPGASEIAYINLANLAVMRDLFRQGSLEQRLYLSALLELSIPPETVCSGVSLPAGETAHRFRAEPVLAMGQSMGGMYANIIGAIDPRIRALAPTGAGGYWSYFITKTSLYDDGAGLVAGLIGGAPTLNFMHPMLNALEHAIEPADPMVYMPRLARRPFDKHPTRSIYEPVAKGDSYFTTLVYDAVALAYGHQQAGAQVWPTMQQVLALDGLSGIISYPVKNNFKTYTGVVVQYEGDGLYDPHAIYTQRDEVQHQYGCFFESFLKTGAATVPAPAPLGTPCP